MSDQEKRQNVIETQREMARIEAEDQRIREEEKTAKAKAKESLESQIGRHQNEAARKLLEKKRTDIFNYEVPNAYSKLLQFLAIYWPLFVTFGPFLQLLGHFFETFCPNFVPFLSLFWLLFGSFLAPFWPVFGPFWPLFGSFLAAFWLLFGPFLAPFWLLFGSFLVSFCLLFGLFLAPF